MSDYLDPNNEELLQDFYAEAESQVELLEGSILVLENDPRNRDAVDEVFRAAHTLKGAAATVQMTELAEFTHVVEDAFDQVRESRASVTSELVDTLLSAVDIIKSMLDARSRKEVFDGDQQSVAAALTAIVAGSAQVTPPGAPATAAAPATSKATSGRTDPATADSAGVFTITVGFDESNPMNSVGGIQVYAALNRIGSITSTNPDFDSLYEDTYHPTVTYHVAGISAPDEIVRTVEIPGVTTTIDIVPPDAPVPVPSVASTEQHGSAPVVDADDETDKAYTTADADAGDDDSAQTTDAPQATGGGSPEPDRKRATPSGSVLRVDSRRVDDLLNLVSEAVINKAAFNQVSIEFAEELTLLNAGSQTFREELRELFEGLPDYLERMQRGASAKEIKREINERFGELYSRFDPFAARFRQSLSKFRSTTGNLSRITGELQEGVMRIRMVPVSQIFSRFPRLVRDLTRTLHKRVDLVIEGEDTELDKSVIEDLLDPLIHCVRNSIDHGLETAEERVSEGKAETGRLVLRASSEGNLIIIEVEDDGRGIDVAAVRQKAIDRGVIHPSKTLSDVEAFNLIFDPGFSTAKKVSSISGRGVGLDVVRKQIEKLNGSVTVWSAGGKGTRFTIKIPLTLAIIQGLMTRVGSETYAIPITSVLESQRIKPSEIRKLDNYEVLNVRDDVISLLRLSRIFGIPTPTDPDHLFVVIVGSGEKKVGLVVDGLIGEEDVVIKPLRDHFTNAPGIAGANITGDGRVSLIIDVGQLLDLGLRAERDSRKQREAVIAR